MRKLLVLALLAASACKGSKTETKPDSEEIAFQKPPSTLGPMFGPAVPVPADWPADVPIYKGAHVSTASSEQKDGGVERVLMYETRDEPARVLDFYRKSFAGKPTFDLAMPMATTIAYEEPGRTISIMVMAGFGARTQVLLTVAPP